MKELETYFLLYAMNLTGKVYKTNVKIDLSIRMIIPIRCFTCGKVVGNKWESYLSLLQVKEL